MGPAVLHAYGFNGARVDASPAIDAGIRVNDCFAIRHADRIAGALLDARLTTGALRLIHFCRHVFTLSNRTQITIEKARDHNALPARLQTKIFAKKIVGRRTAAPAGKASVFQAGPGPACAVTPGSLGGFLPQTPHWVPAESWATRRRLGDQLDRAGRPGDHPDPSGIRGLRASRAAAAIALTRSLGSDWAIQSRTLSNSSP